MIESKFYPVGIGKHKKKKQDEQSQDDGYEMKM